MAALVGGGPERGGPGGWWSSVWRGVVECVAWVVECVALGGRALPHRLVPIRRVLSHASLKTIIPIIPRG